MVIIWEYVYSRISILVNNYYIYMYYDPDTNIPFYIGKGRYNRYRDVGSRSYNKCLHRKIQKLRKIKKYKVADFTKILFENLTNEEAFEHEICLIKQYGRKHLNEGPLLNFTEGGGGVMGHPKEKTSKIIKDEKTFRTLIFIEKRTIKQIAAYYNCSIGTVRKVASFLKIPMLGRKKQLPKNEVLELYKKEKSIISLAKKFNCDRDVIVRILKENNIPIEDGRISSAFRGGKGHSKLKNQTNVIIEWHKQNKSVNFIAKQLNVSNDSIIHILKMNNFIPPSKTIKRERLRQYALEIINLYKNKTSVKIIAAKFNTTIFIIQQILKENGISLRNKKGNNK